MKLYVQCCGCKKYLIKNNWKEAPAIDQTTKKESDLVRKILTHCPECYEIDKKRIDLEYYMPITGKQK